MSNINMLQQLIFQFSKLPSLGERSARRIVLNLLQNRDKLQNLIAVLEVADKNIVQCGVCGNFDTEYLCEVCKDENRDKKTVCIVENIADLWAMERSGIYNGQYHILGGLLSSINNITPEKLRINNLIDRIKENDIVEIIIAISATLDGQTTSYYINDVMSEIVLKNPNFKISRLAFGIPIGAEIEYIDEGTLSVAMKLRQLIG